MGGRPAFGDGRSKRSRVLRGGEGEPDIFGITSRPAVVPRAGRRCLAAGDGSCRPGSASSSSASRPGRLLPESEIPAPGICRSGMPHPRREVVFPCFLRFDAPLGSRVALRRFRAVARRRPKPVYALRPASFGRRRRLAARDRRLGGRGAGRTSRRRAATLVELLARRLLPRGLARRKRAEVLDGRSSGSGGSSRSRSSRGGAASPRSRLRRRVPAVRRVSRVLPSAELGRHVRRVRPCDRLRSSGAPARDRPRLSFSEPRAGAC